MKHGGKEDWDDGDPEGEKKRTKCGAKVEWDDGDPEEVKSVKRVVRRSVEINWATMSWVATNETPPNRGDNTAEGAGGPSAMSNTLVACG